MTISSALFTLSPTTSSASNPDKPSSDQPRSGLSSGAKAGIGAGIGGAVLIAVIVLGLFLWRKRKQRAQYVQPGELGHDALTTKYEMYHDTAAKHELPSTVAVEVPHNEKPAELPGHMPANNERYP